MRTFLLSLALSAAANAGVVKVATYPVRHPVSTVKHTAKASVKTVKAVSKAVYGL